MNGNALTSFAKSVVKAVVLLMWCMISVECLAIEPQASLEKEVSVIKNIDTRTGKE